jgi:hypothetical protein
MRRRLSRVVFALTVACTALFAHAAIDVAGDVVLPRDAYDDGAHLSPESIFIVASALAAVVAWHTLRAVAAELAGTRGSLRALLGASVPDSCARFVGGVALGTVPVLLAMAVLDAWLGGRSVADPADLLGGSIPLGMACIVAAALVTGACAWKALRALATLDVALLRFAAVLSERARDGRAALAALARGGMPAPSAASICARSVGLRAPPRTARLRLYS